MTFGEKINKIRVEKGMTQDELARRYIDDVYKFSTLRIAADLFSGYLSFFFKFVLSFV